MSRATEIPEPHFLYWVLTAAVMAVAVFSAASIGLFLLVLGLTLLVRGVKGRPQHGFWPPIIGFGLFFAVFNLVGYLVGLHASGTRMSTTQEITSVIPALWTSILIAVAVGFGGAYLARIGLLRLARKRNQLTHSPAP